MTQDAARELDREITEIATKIVAFGQRFHAANSLLIDHFGAHPEHDIDDIQQLCAALQLEEAECRRQLEQLLEERCSMV